MPNKERDFNLLSIVVPLYNEAELVDELIHTIAKAVSGLACELVLVNDGSHDDTMDKVLGAQYENLDIRLVNFSRNFGKEIALCAGMDHAKGDIVALMDGDLQHSPAYILEMIELWRQGVDMVYAVRESRNDETWLKRIAAKLFYKILNKVSEVDIPLNGSDFRLMDRKVVDSILRLRESGRFTKGLYAWVGFKSASISYLPEPRQEGVSSWGFKALWNLGLSGIIGFSTVPLRIWSYIGGLLAFSSLLYGTVIIVDTIISGKDAPGYASIMVTVAFLGGIQLISLGVIGEYVARIFVESKSRPLYITDGIYRNGELVPEQGVKNQQG